MDSANTMTPYPGPRPFEIKEKDLFFGREREKRDIHSLVIAHRAVVVFSQSGAGKTSLLKAGLVPILQDEGIEVLPIARVQGVDPAKLGIERVANIFAFNALLSWSDDTSEPKSLAATTLAEFLGRRARAKDKHGDPVIRVAIFDQFEELFTAYPAQWEQRRALIEQIAAACAADPRLRVVLVIREDHLAELMPHSELLPEELRSSYRLERLGEAAAIEAVEKPLTGTSRSFAEGVAKSLVKRLLQVKLDTSAQGQVPVQAQYVEPVQLQVVCQRLWRRLPDSVAVVSDEQLRAFGDIDEALRSFYEESIAATVADTGVAEDQLRRWFDSQLVTSAGTRGTVFQGEKATGGIPNRAVDLLESDHHIVRAELRYGSRWYELTHDRFITPIRESNADWFKRAAKKRWQYRAVTYGLVFLAGSIGLQGYLADRAASNAKAEAERATQQQLEQQKRQSELELAKQRQRAELEKQAAVELEAARLDLQKKAEIAEIERAQTSALELQQRRFELDRQDALRRDRLAQSERQLNEGQFDRLRALKEDGKWSNELAEAVFDGVANSLWAKGEVNKLSTLLRNNADLIPERYGLDENALRLMQPIDDSADWPLTVQYGPQAQLDNQRFLYHWRLLSSKLAAMWGIPAPMRLKLQENHNLSAREFRIVATPNRRESAADAVIKERVTIATGASDVVVNKPAGPAALVKFFDENKKSRLTQFKYGGEWWLVPAWTQPVWKVAGHYSYDRDGAVALAIANQAINRPELLLDRDAVAYLLKRLALRRPDTVGEALAVRGLDRLTQDLTRIVAEPHKTHIKDLEHLLDSLANWPDATAEQAALAATKDQTSLVRSAPTRLGNSAARKKDSLKTLETSAQDRRHVYEEVSPWLNASDAVVRIVIGEHIDQRLFSKDKLSPDARQALTELQGGFERRFGFRPPQVRFRLDKALPADSLRIEIADLDDRRAIEAKGGDPLPIVISELNQVYTAYRSWWLTPESVSELLRPLRPAKKKWLSARYSLTDLKLILRAVVVDPTGLDRDAIEQGDDAAALSRVREEQTIAKLDWLIGSLIFWAATSPDEHDLAGITVHLRQSQRVRLAGPSPATSPVGIAKTVEEGIKALQDDQADLAMKLFGESAARDRPGATAAFHSLYAAQATGQETLTSVEQACPLPAPGRIAKTWAPGIRTRDRIKDFIEQAGATIPVADRRHLDLCLLWYAVIQSPPQKTEEIHRRLSQSLAMGGWSAPEQYLFAYLLLSEHGREMSAPKSQSEIEQLLGAAFASLEPADAEAAFTELVGRLASTSGAPRWYIELLRPLSSSKPDSFWMPLRMGMFLTYGGRRDDPQDSLELLATAKSRLSAIDAEDRPRLQAWLDLARADALIESMDFEARPDPSKLAYEEAKGLIGGVLARRPDDAQEWPKLDHVFASLVSAHYAASRPSDIARDVQRWRSQAPDSQEAARHEVIVCLTKLEADRAVDLVQSPLAKSAGDGQDQRAEMLYLAALVETLVGKGNFEEDARTFLNDTHHRNRDFVRLLLSWRLKREGRDGEADELIEQRMETIDPTSWANRLSQGGDRGVWGEQLIGFYAGRVKREELTALIRTKESFATSAISATGLSYESIATDINFYDALLHDVSGDPASRRTRFRAALERASQIGRFDFFETHMARYLLNSRE